MTDQLARILLFTAALAGFTGFNPDARAQIISTVAGNGVLIFSGDGGPATSAQLNKPLAVATDGAGNTYIADASNNRVRKISPSGTITTLAGNGIAGFSGDGGLATAAELNTPSGLALDAAGNIYIADSYNNRIRVVSPSGQINTFAGTGTAGFSGDNNQAAAAKLNYPEGVASDASGNVFIADAGNHRIRYVNGSTGVITTVAGNGLNGNSGDGGLATAAELSYPGAVALDAAGDVLIADTNNNRIRQLDGAGVINGFAGTGTPGYSGDGAAASAGEFFQPSGIAADGAGVVFIADNGNHRLRQVNASGVLSTAAGTGVPGFSGDGGLASLAQLNLPAGVATDGAGNIYLADGGNNRIRKMTRATGILTTVAGNGVLMFSGDGGPATTAQLFNPVGVALDGAGNMYIADCLNNRIRKVDASGTITTIAGNGTAAYSGDGGPATAASLNNPSAVITGDSGSIYIADASNSRIRKINAAGIISTVAGNGTTGYTGDGGPATAASFNIPQSMAFDKQGNMFICDRNNCVIRKIAANGIISTFAGVGGYGFAGDGGPATAAKFATLDGVAVDAAGNVYIADSQNNRIRMVNTSGIITTIAGNGTTTFSGDGGPANMAGVVYPYGLAFDYSGNLLIVDFYDNRIRMINTQGVITTVAGMGTAGFSGDGGTATLAELNFPQGVTADVAGNMYIADQSNNRIRKVTAFNGIAEQSLAAGIKIYPVPSAGKLWADLSGKGYTALTLTDLKGREIYSLQLNPNEFNPHLTIELSAFANGLYNLQVAKKELHCTKRVAIQH